MRFVFAPIAAAAALLPVSVDAQCFNRPACDPSMLEVRSQMSVNVPVADQASEPEIMKTMEDARRDLYALSNRECDTLKSTFGGDCTLSAININSSMQERGPGAKYAIVSISNTFQVKKAPK